MSKHNHQKPVPEPVTQDPVIPEASPEAPPGPEVVAQQEGPKVTAHAQGASGRFIGILDKPNGLKVPACLYLKDGVLVAITAPFDRDDQPGREKAWVDYDLGMLHQLVLKEGVVK
jgi:hypothetical protein